MCFRKRSGKQNYKIQLKSGVPDQDSRNCVYTEKPFSTLPPVFAVDPPSGESVAPKFPAVVYPPVVIIFFIGSVFI